MNTRICARGILINNSQIYIIKEDTRQDVDCWFLPGGKIEDNESIESGLKRELSEEIGINESEIIFYDELLGSYNFYLKNGDLNVNLTFRVDFSVPDTIKNQGESKVVDQKLVDKNNITEYLADSVNKDIRSNILPNLK